MTWLTTVAIYVAATTLLQRQTALSCFVSLCFCNTVTPISGSICWHGQEALHFCYTQYGYFPKGVCRSPNPDILHHSQTAGLAVLSVGKSTGKRLWVKLLQRGSQKDYCLLPEISAPEQHIHSPPDTCHTFAKGVLYLRRQQRGTSRGTPASTFHLWNFHTWQLLSVLHNHFFFPM